MVFICSEGGVGDGGGMMSSVDVRRKGYRDACVAQVVARATAKKSCWMNRALQLQKVFMDSEVGVGDGWYDEICGCSEQDGPQITCSEVGLDRGSRHDEIDERSGAGGAGVV